MHTHIHVLKYMHKIHTHTHIGAPTYLHKYTIHRHTHNTRSYIYIHTYAYRCTSTHAHKSQVLFFLQRKRGRKGHSEHFNNQASLLPSESHFFPSASSPTPPPHSASSQTGPSPGQFSGQMMRLLSECHGESVPTGPSQMLI